MPTLIENPTTGFFTRCISWDGKYMGEITHVHSPYNCAGRGCSIHAHPSDHALKDAPMFWREDRGILERTCEHGVGHPDHDSAAYLTSIGRDYENVHGCDGCCMTAEQRVAEVEEAEKEVVSPTLTHCTDGSLEQAYYDWRGQFIHRSPSAKEAFLAGAEYAAGKN